MEDHRQCFNALTKTIRQLLLDFSNRHAEEDDLDAELFVAHLLASAGHGILGYLTTLFEHKENYKTISKVFLEVTRDQIDRVFEKEKLAASKAASPTFQ